LSAFLHESIHRSLVQQAVLNTDAIKFLYRLLNEIWLRDRVLNVSTYISRDKENKIYLA